MLQEQLHHRQQMGWSYAHSQKLMLRRDLEKTLHHRPTATISG